MAAMGRARAKARAKQPTQPTQLAEGTPKSVLARLRCFIAESVTLCVLGAIAGVLGVFFYTPVLLALGILLYFGLHRSGALIGLSRRKRILSYAAVSVVMWPGLYGLNHAMQQKTSGDQARGLLPGVSLIGDKIVQALDRLSRNIDEQGHFARWPDPVVHIEPENALLWSTKPGQSLGAFELTLVNTGPEDIDTIRAEQFYFVAEKTEDLVLKTLSHAVSVEILPQSLGKNCV